MNHLDTAAVMLGGALVYDVANRAASGEWLSAAVGLVLIVLIWFAVSEPDVEPDTDIVPELNQTNISCFNMNPHPPHAWEYPAYDKNLKPVNAQGFCPGKDYRA